MRKGFLLKKIEKTKEDEQKAETPAAAADMLSAAAEALPGTSAATGAVPKKISAAKMVGGARRRRRNIPRSRQHKNFIEKSHKTGNRHLSQICQH